MNSIVRAISNRSFVLLGCVGLLAASAASAPARAQEPAQIASLKAALRKECSSMGKTGAFGAGAIRTADFNGDGKPDFIVDYAKIDCGTMYCGTAGCTVAIFVSQGAGHVSGFENNLRSWTVKRAGARDVLVVDLHGSACGKVGAAACSKTLGWNGKTFAPVR